MWKRVFLSSTGPVTIRNPYVETELPLPATNPASLTVRCDLSDPPPRRCRALFQAKYHGRASLRPNLRKPLICYADQTKEISFTPTEFTQLSVADPDLWWPYQLGEAKLYHLKLEFKVNEKNQLSDSQAIDFGIRKITQGRDSDTGFPEIGEGGNFYLKVNGKDYLIRRESTRLICFSETILCGMRRSCITPRTLAESASLGIENSGRHYD